MTKEEVDADTVETFSGHCPEKLGLELIPEQKPMQCTAESGLSSNCLASKFSVITDPKIKGVGATASFEPQGLSTTILCGGNVARDSISQLESMLCTTYPLKLNCSPTVWQFKGHLSSSSQDTAKVPVTSRINWPPPIGAAPLPTRPYFQAQILILGTSTQYCIICLPPAESLACDFRFSYSRSPAMPSKKYRYREGQYLIEAGPLDVAVPSTSSAFQGPRVQLQALLIR